MRKTFAVLAVLLAVGMTTALDAHAKRLGGGKSAGMQRQTTSAPAPTNGAGGTNAAPTQAAPAAGATAAAAPGAAAAAAPKRSWMGPVAGLAAGLGIAALASHFGFGGALANILTMALIAMAVMAVIGFVLRKRAASQGGAFAGAGAPGRLAGARAPEQGLFRSGLQQPQPTGSMIGSRLAGGIGSDVAAPGVGTIPAGFDTAAFERTARDQFLALQAANDARDLERLRDYLSPEMFEVVCAEIAERGQAPQQTEVFGLHAQVLDVAEEAGRYVVSVRFSGSIREQSGIDTQDLNEVWHLAKPTSGFGGWVVAGIQQA